MHRSQIIYEPGKEEQARLVCPRCRELLDEDSRVAMVHNGEWMATQPFRGRRGYHANSILWPHPINRVQYPGGQLQRLAMRMEQVKASSNVEKSKRVMINTEDAECYEPPEDKKADPSTLMQQREPWSPGKVIPDGVLYVTCGADGQKDRIECEFVGFGENGEEWGLGYYILNGPILGPHVWKAFDELLSQTTWETENGRRLTCEAGGIDSRYRPDAVYKFTRRRGHRKIYAVQGSTSLCHPIVTGPKWLGNPKSAVWEIGTHELKDQIYQHLELSPERLESGAVQYPLGYMHYPQIDFYNEEYFKRLTCEDSYLKQGPDGKWYRFFFKKKGDRNEPIDLRVYAKAIAEKLRKNVPLLAQQAREFSRERPPEEKKETVDVLFKSNWVLGRSNGRKWI
jgi:phage terminase large subunit GpA-like protein